MMPAGTARRALIAASLRCAATSAPKNKNEITETMLH
jgi:hypothetical protein